MIEDQNSKEAARYMIKSARDTACDNFTIGLKRDIIWRVRVARPKNLQEAINLAKTAEWEVDFESRLNRKEKKLETEVEEEGGSLGQIKKQENTHGRFRPYYSNARVRQVEAGRSRGSGLRGRGKEGGSVKQGGKNNSGSQSEVKCHKCGEIGHFARGCARVFSISKTNCSTCNQLGHLAHECNNPKGKHVECFKCKKPGHYARECTEGNGEKERKETNVCNYCKYTGHHYDDCIKRLKKIVYGRQDKHEALNEK